MNRFPILSRKQDRYADGKWGYLKKVMQIMQEITFGEHAMLIGYLLHPSSEMSRLLSMPWWPEG